MADRKGEKAGWTFGWLGSFLWVAVFVAIFLARGRTFEGIVGLVLVLLAVLFVFAFAPWRRPEKRLWTLMLPLYLVFFAGAAWAIRSFGGLKAAGLSWWFLPLLIPILMPLGIVGGRKWADGEKSKF